MKKITALLLAFCMIFCLTSCKEGGDDNKLDYGIDINYYVSTGMISEAKYGIGTNPDDIEREAESQSGEHDHTGGDGDIGIISYADYLGKEAYIVDGFYYCFKTGEEANSISCIVGTNNIFGFTAGMTTKYEISNIISSLNPESSLSGAKEFFYMPFEMENVDTLTVKNGNNVLKFYFEEDILISAALFNSEKWEF